MTQDVSQQSHPADGTCPMSKISLGQQYDPPNPIFIANPYPFYAQARQEEPIFFGPLVNAWVVTRYEDAIAILKDHQHFANITSQTGFTSLTPKARAILRPSPLLQAPDLVAAGPPEHTRLRRPVARAFSPQRIASLELQMRAYANQLIDHFAPWGQMDFVEHFASPYPLIVMADLLNIPELDRDLLHHWSQSLMTILLGIPSPEEQLACAQQVVALWSYLLDLAQERQRTPQDDLISDVCQAGEAEQATLCPVEVAGLLYTLLIAGTGTVTKFLANCLCHLLSRQSHWQALLQKPEGIQEVVEEALRFDTPGLSAWRMAKEDVVIKGVSIPKGARVQVLLSSANRDEALFSQPETFDPSRENSHRHLSFGQGIHVCLGAALARLEIRVALEQLSQRLPSLRLVSDQELSYTQNLLSRGLKELLVEWDL